MQFQVTKLDVADAGDCSKIISLAEEMAPVGGIFHLAMTLNDKLLSNQASSLLRVPKFQYSPKTITSGLSKNP